MGRRVRQRRWMLGMPREALAMATGVAPDALKRFETGFDFIEATHLVAIAATLGIRLSDLTAGAQERPAAQATASAAAASASAGLGLEVMAFPSAVG